MKSRRDLDVGGRPRPTSIRELTLVGAGTPGRPGLVYARCAHRGTMLYYGRVEERGIRCCYHGWLFDVEGRCLEQPCEPDGGRQRERIRQPWYPRVAQYARVETIGWVLPIDDTSFRIYTAGRVRSPGEIASVRSRLNGKLWEALTPEEHQRFPGDYEAQVGQGPVTFHSEENLVSSDRGVALVRRLLKQQLEALAEGRDPIGVTFDDTAPPVPFEAGNFLIEGRHAS